MMLKCVIFKNVSGLVLLWFQFYLRHCTPDLIKWSIYAKPSSFSKIPSWLSSLLGGKHRKHGSLLSPAFSLITDIIHNLTWDLNYFSIIFPWAELEFDMAKLHSNFTFVFERFESVCPFLFIRGSRFGFLFFCLFRAMEVPRLGVKSELHQQAYTTAIAMPDLSHICDLHHSSQQRQILNPLSKVRDRTCVLMETSQIRYHGATTGIPVLFLFFNNLLSRGKY